MKWNSPSNDFPYLSLPKISNNFIDIETAKCNSNIPVTPEFINTWENGPSSHSKKDIHDALLILIKEYALLAKNVKSFVSSTTKGHPTDLVTETDQGIEMLFRLWIYKHLPTHKIIGEEGSKDQIEKNDIVWFIDPIDGTSNYVETPIDQNPLVTMHFGSTYQGKSFISIIATPFQNKLYSYYPGIKKPNIPSQPIFTKDSIKRIGSEFSGKRAHNSQYLHTLCEEENKTPAQYKSIGINLIGVLEGHIECFYKDSTKLWDVMAPLILVENYRNDLKVECLYTKTNTPLNKKNTQSITPFSNEPIWQNHLNKRHHISNKNNNNYCRAGIILVYPKNNIELREKMLNAIWKGKGIL